MTAMSQKRTLLPDAYKSRKRICVAPPPPPQQDNQVNGNNVDWDSSQESSNHIDVKSSDLPSDTKAALLYVKNLFPLEKFEGRLPPIILKHQLYSIVKNRTLVDKEVGELRTNGEIRLFKLGSNTNDFCVVFTEDYKSHVLHFIQQVHLQLYKSVIDKFFSTVLTQCQDVSLSKQRMYVEFQFKDEEITQLIKACVLTVRDVGSWWLAIPSAGVFMKSFIRGRKAVLTMVRKCKYKEILQQDLESRKLPRIARLGMTYHIHDIIGADLVECIPTTSGQLLRLQE